MLLADVKKKLKKEVFLSLYLGPAFLEIKKNRGTSGYCIRNIRGYSQFKRSNERRKAEGGTGALLQRWEKGG